MVPKPSVLGHVQPILAFTIGRDLGNNPAYILPAYSKEQEYVLQILAATFSAISVASATLAFYWFLKMRRSFRHDLIMFLIQSDMFKALWFMVYPFVAFTRGPIASSSTFCQVNGFFISLGTEASDFAVLMIALHTALYIFKPESAPGEGGLYPYRRIAFILWIIFPVLMASLAFVNEGNAYTSQSTYCNLPLRPFWFRLALGWMPRYIICVVILVIYASLYFFVNYKFRKFGNTDMYSVPGVRNQNSAGGQHGNGISQRLPKRHNLPTTPPLVYHGLIPVSRESSFGFQDARKPSVSTIDSSQDPKSKLKMVDVRSSYLTQDHSGATSNQSPLLNDHLPSQLPVGRHNNATAATSPESSTPISAFAPAPVQRWSSATSWTTWATSFYNRRSTSDDGRMRLLTFLRLHRHRPGSESVVSTPLSQLELVNSQGQNLVVLQMAKTREKIRRQLRFLFIYPLVYIGMWILPFVSHVLQYDDAYASGPPYVLSAFVTVIITSQCAVDCWLFSTREKPWRQIPSTTGGFWESLAFWKTGMTQARTRSGSGKSRAEMVSEARVAYRRRDEEIAARQSEVDNSQEGWRTSQQERRERSWWDDADISERP